MKKKVGLLSFSVIMLLLANCNLFSPAPVTTPGPGSAPSAQTTESLTATPAQSGESATITPLPQRSDILSSANAKDVGEIVSWGIGSGHHPTYSPDGKLLAVSSATGIYLYDSQTLQESMHIGEANNVLAMAFSPDGKTLSAVEDSYPDKIVTQWDLASGSQLHSSSVGPTGDQYPIDIYALSPDGKTAAISVGPIGDTNPVKVLDVASGKELHSLSVQSLMYLAFSLDGKILAVADYEKVTLWDVSSGSQLRTIDPGYFTSITLAFLPDGKTLAIGTIYSCATCTKYTVTLWDLAVGSKLLSFDTPIVPKFSGDPLFKFAFSPDGKTVATGSAVAIKLWDAPSGNELHSIDASNLESLTFPPDGKMLVSAYSVGDDSVKLWDAATGNLLNTVKGDVVSTNVIFSADSSTLAYAAGNTVKLRDVASGEIRSLGMHPNFVDSIAFSPDGKTLASGSFDKYPSTGNNVLKLWDAASGSEMHTFSWQTTAVYCVAFSPDGKTLASGGDYAVKLWDVASGSEVRTLNGGNTELLSVAFSPDG
ncbi:MAG TPA: WD40 repeat domain-containing protein, partial [Anaerolineales bacterium]